MPGGNGWPLFLSLRSDAFTWEPTGNNPPNDTCDGALPFEYSFTVQYSNGNPVQLFVFTHREQDVQSPQSAPLSSSLPDGGDGGVGAGVGGHVPVPFTHRPLTGSTTEPHGPAVAHAVQEHVPVLHAVSMAAHHPVLSLHVYPHAG